MSPMSKSVQPLEIYNVYCRIRSWYTVLETSRRCSCRAPGSRPEPRAIRIGNAVDSVTVFSIIAFFTFLFSIVFVLARSRNCDSSFVLEGETLLVQYGDELHRLELVDVVAFRCITGNDIDDTVLVLEMEGGTIYRFAALRFPQEQVSDVEVALRSRGVRPLKKEAGRPDVF